ncbi:MAG TPA: hypothetical protein VNH84_01405 [Candidatus Saccharimonadales bacterium]|nr:hypothetical protein [Candidatus Saccharimonadales bacterium]
MSAAMEARWTERWRSLRPEWDPRPAWRQLQSAYTEPHRHYHNLTHLQECLAEFDSARHLVHDPAAVELALWFHDFCYDTRTGDNEERSALAAEETLSTADLPGPMREQIRRLILDTKHQSPPASPDGELLVDVDLSILGRPRPRFEEYEHQIRREYSWVPAVVFAFKRRGILKGFLKRPTLYRTEFFRERYEAQAKANLKWSVKLLKRGA